jgi:predicted porin
MQKKLIALAIAGLASSAAMAQVTVYGRLDTSYINTETDATTAGVTTTTEASSTGFGAGALTTSRLGFMVSEDLGMGLTGKANLELAIANTAATGGDTGADFAAPFTTRLANVGIAGSFGEVTLGRQTTLVEQAWFGGSVGGQNNAIGTAYSPSIKFNNTRSSELITYASPVFSGLKFGVQYAFGKTDTSTPGTNNKHKELGLVATYTAGPLNVNVGFSSEEQSAASVRVSEAEQLVVSGSYDFGVVKVYGLIAQGEDSKNNTSLATTTPAQSREAFEVGVKVPLGKVTLLGSLYQGETDFDLPASVDRDLSGMQLGALYSFSKRTTAYGLYGMTEVENQTGNTTTETNQFAIGLRHDF